MKRRLAPFLAVAAAGIAAPPATADHWPLAGGSASRASHAQGVGDPPITPTWSAPDGAVRTPVLITGGGGSGNQRVAYGTGDGFLHLRMLESGAPVGPGEGIDIDGGSINDDERVFGEGNGAVGFADTSTEQRHGLLYVVHNDDPVAADAVFIARQRVDTGELVGEVIVDRSAQCAINSSPLLTPATGAGSRILYFTMLCPLYEYLVRLPIEGDATSPSSSLGEPGYAMVPDITDSASPTLTVLRDEAGTPRYHVVVPRRGGLTIFDAENPLDAAPGNTATPPAITAELGDSDELAQTPAVPRTAEGELAPALYVAADAAGSTRVYRFVQDGGARVLRATGATGPLPASGAPAPGLAVADGSLLVTSASNLTLLRAEDLSIAAQASGTPLPEGFGFSRTVPVVSGAHAFVVRDGDSDTPAEHLVLRLDGLTPLQPPAFSPSPDPVAGPVAGQPAGSRGKVVFGTARGPFAYASQDARQAPPGETIKELPPTACAKQMRGTRRRDRIVGTQDGDRILGGAGHDRLSGGGGPDCLFGQSGNDVLSGGSGDDLLEGGAGSDRLAGGPGQNQLSAGGGNDRITATGGGRDRIDCGKGRDRVVADRRDRVSRSCERVKRRR